MTTAGEIAYQMTIIILPSIEVVANIALKALAVLLQNRWLLLCMQSLQTRKRFVARQDSIQC